MVDTREYIQFRIGIGWEFPDQNKKLVAANHVSPYPKLKEVEAVSGIHGVKRNLYKIFGLQKR